MKKIGFIGAYDKTDFILYVSRILVEMGNKVLFIDATITQKARYVVPNIQKEKSYITEFEGIDVAVGMKSFGDILEYLDIQRVEELPYDYILIDTNSAGGVMSYRINECEEIFLATSLDMYDIKKGIESLSIIKDQIEVTKVMFSRYAMKEDIEYIDYLASGSNIKWNNEIIYFPFEMGDRTTIQKNQRVSKIKLRGLTPQYKEGLKFITSRITGNINYKEILKTFKTIEKGV